MWDWIEKGLAVYINDVVKTTVDTGRAMVVIETTGCSSPEDHVQAIRNNSLSNLAYELDANYGFELYVTDPHSPCQKVSPVRFDDPVWLKIELELLHSAPVISLFRRKVVADRSMGRDQQVSQTFVRMLNQSILEIKATKLGPVSQDTFDTIDGIPNSHFIDANLDCLYVLVSANDAMALHFRHTLTISPFGGLTATNGINAYMGWMRHQLRHFPSSNRAFAVI